MNTSRNRVTATGQTWTAGPPRKQSPGESAFRKALSCCAQGSNCPTLSGTRHLTVSEQAHRHLHVFKWRTRFGIRNLPADCGGPGIRRDSRIPSPHCRPQLIRSSELRANAPPATNARFAEILYAPALQRNRQRSGTRSRLDRRMACPPVRSGCQKDETQPLALQKSLRS